MAENRKISYLEHYLDWFKDKPSGTFIDLMPDNNSGETHVGLETRFNTPLPPNTEPSEAMAKYTHPCWCNPELIYANDLKGQEVWLHKRIQ